MERSDIKGIALLGSTGSIGHSALDVIRGNPDRFIVLSLCAGRNIKLLKTQIEEFKPRFVSVLTQGLLKELRKTLSSTKSIEFGFGIEGAKTAATLSGVDMVISAIVGADGFLPTLGAIKAGKDIALANKETLVMGGPLVMREVKRKRVRLLPVDSEHSAIFQALCGHRKSDVRSLILTASGGPFLKTPLKRFSLITPKLALNHPTWSMGKRITVDASTMMNKGFEVIEARWMFGVAAEKIKVFVHPQSVVHSMVEYVDGSIMAQMGSSDMRLPIAYALGYPKRLDVAAKPFNLIGKKLEFIEPDLKRFPCLDIAYKAMDYGETAPAALNAADEVCVDMFLKGMIKFTDIPVIIERVLSRHITKDIGSVEDILEADHWARKVSLEIIKSRAGGHPCEKHGSALRSLKAY